MKKNRHWTDFLCVAAGVLLVFHGFNVVVIAGILLILFGLM